MPSEISVFLYFTAMNNQRVNKVYSVEAARPKLEKYCAYQERSHKQVYDKCRLLGLSEDQANELLVELIRSNFLSEERFVSAYVKGKFKIKSWGKHKISQGLKLAGVGSKMIQETIQEIDKQEYIKTIQELAAKKSKTVKANSEFEKKVKIQRYLMSKGYSLDDIQSALNEDAYL